MNFRNHNAQMPNYKQIPISIPINRDKFQNNKVLLASLLKGMFILLILGNCFLKGVI
jgi:hypothetical protein